MSAAFSNVSAFEMDGFSHGQIMDITNDSIDVAEHIMRDESGEDDEDESDITFISIRRVQIVISFVGKFVLPAVVSVYYAVLRNHRSALDNVKQQVIPAIVAFFTNSISSVQVAVTTYPSNRIDPLLKRIKFKYRTIQEEVEEDTHEEKEKCVHCTVLCEPPKGEAIRADVIFIHGLHGSLVKTWRQGDWRYKKKHTSLQRRSSLGCLQHVQAANHHHNNNNNNAAAAAKRTVSMHGNQGGDHLATNCDAQDGGYSRCWPKDWLPQDCPGIRVIAINYTTDPYLWRPVWVQKKKRTSIEERSTEMLDLLHELGVGKKPIVWVGHSKGGLFIKQMLVNSWESHSNFHLQTKAIMFYSVPHMGASLADFSLPFIRRSIELLEIRKDCEKVMDLHRKFLNIFRDQHFHPEIFSFIETSFTFMSFVYLRIVTKESADPGVGEICWVPLDHREICKPRGRNCFLYQELVELINKVVY